VRVPDFEIWPVILDIKRELIVICGMHAATKIALEESWLEDLQQMSLV
jgi:hypothetical protein